jgi:hypothetical protein
MRDFHDFRAAKIGLSLSALRQSRASNRPTGKPRRAGNTMVPRWVKMALRLNPMTDLIGFFRAAVLGGPLPWARLDTSVAVICPS